MLKLGKNRKGQAAIEFMVCVVVIFFFLLFFLSLAMLMVTSEYLDYAVFMAARTYKAGGGSEAGARERANNVLGKYTDKIALVRNYRLNFTKTIPNDEQTAGVELQYDMDLFYLPPLFVDAKSGAWENRITLTSEAHLGRDPGNEECRQFFEQFVRTVPGLIGNPDFAIRMEDNGC